MANDAAYVGKAVLTDKGLQLIAKLLALKTALDITRAAVGDGDLPPDAALEKTEAMANPVMEALLSGCDCTGNGEATITMQVNSINVERGFFVKEIGIYAQDPDEGEILYAYMTFGDRPEWVRAMNDVINKFATFCLTIIIGRVEQISVAIAPGALAYLEDLKKYALLGHRHKIEDVDGLPETLDNLRKDSDAADDELGAEIEDVNGRIDAVWGALFEDITSNPFTIAFANLDGVVVESGVWNEARQRLEC